MPSKYSSKYPPASQATKSELFASDDTLENKKSSIEGVGLQDLINYAYELAEYGEFDTEVEGATFFEINDALMVRLITQGDIIVEVNFESTLVLRAVNSYYDEEFLVQEYESGPWEALLENSYYQ